MKEVINAFHPLYARTYHPELFDSLRTESRQKKAGEPLRKNYYQPINILCNLHFNLKISQNA